MNIVDMLRDKAQSVGDAPALVDFTGGRERRLSFAELDDATARTAGFLDAEGLRPGDAVLLFVPMSVDLYIALLGVLRAGMTVAFIDPSAGRRLMEQCCERYALRGMVGVPQAHLLRLVSPGIRRIPVRFTTGVFPPFTRRWNHWVRHAPRGVASVAPDDPALVTFTSGSTGVPKVAVRTHDFLLAQHRVLASELDYSVSDRVYTTLPIFVLSHLGSGVPTIIADVDLRRPGAVDPGPVVACILREDVTAVEAPPAFLERIADHCESRSVTLSGVRKIFTGGAPVFPSLLDRLQRLAPQAAVIALYGSTEAEPIAHIARDRITPEDVAAMIGGRGLVTGAPVPDIDLRILPGHRDAPLEDMDEEAFEAACVSSEGGGTSNAESREDPPGPTPRATAQSTYSGAGEIVVSGDHVLAGYHEGVGDEETKFRVDGRVWHRTGDAGYLDDQGRLWLLGRCSARITDARGTLYPFAVECAAYDDPAVRRSAFVSRGGKRILVVELLGNATGKSAAIIERLTDRLSWACIDRILPCERIPMDRRHNSKIDYPALDKLLDGMVGGG